MKICQQCGTQYDGTQTFCTRDGEVLQDDHAEMIGRVLDGQYQIEEFIAEGGMGAVYRARHTLLGDKVAIKLLPPEMRRNAAWLKRFQREGQAARRFHHPNSVIVHDLRTSSEGEIYLVMEFVEGRTLDALAAERGGRLSLTETLQIIEPVASVLDAAHAMGVVHRDLKPSNIMITSQGIVKLLDLGVAKVTDMGAGATSLTMTGQLLGTPYYMSPEQWGELPRDGSEEIDGRTDVYSLGVVVYKITTGEFPCKGTSVVTLRRAHCQEAARPLEEYDPTIPPGWSSAVLRAISKDRNDRQPTAGEFAGELRAAIGGINPRYESARAVLPTLLMQSQQATSPGVHSTPQNLQAPTINAYEGELERAQPTVASNFSPGPPPAHVQRMADQRPSRARWLVATAAILLLLAVGVFGLWQWRGGFRSRRRGANIQANSPANTQADAEGTSDDESSQNTPDGETNARGDVFMRYHLQLAPTMLDPWVPYSGRDPVTAGQIVQFIIKSRESGYLYMFGQDDVGNTVIMPMGDADDIGRVMTRAKITASNEGLFPTFPLIKLNTSSGVETFTVFFSEKPLALPFANITLPLDGSFRKLTTDEQRSLDDLRKQAVPATVQFDGDAAVVKLQGERGTRPVVFDIKLKLRRP